MLTVGETWGATPEIAKQYSNPAHHELSMIFQFEHVGLDEIPGKSKWDLRPLQISELKQVFSKWQTELGDEGWNSLFWNNHDLPRIVSRWGNDGDYRVESAKMLAILLHMMKGTPYIYQGEEIGMTNRPISTISEVNDIESINMYQERLAQGFEASDIIHSINAKGRDNARTPMQWDASNNAGFSKAEPWLPVNPNYQTINVAAALADDQSIFYTYQRLIQLRKKHDLIKFGDFELINETEAEVFAYRRTYQGEKWLIVSNFSEQSNFFTFDGKVDKLIIANMTDLSLDLNHKLLRPYEAFVVKLRG